MIIEHHEIVNSQLVESGLVGYLNDETQGASTN